MNCWLAGWICPAGQSNSACDWTPKCVRMKEEVQCGPAIKEKKKKNCDHLWLYLRVSVTIISFLIESAALKVSVQQGSGHRYCISSDPWLTVLISLLLLNCEWGVCCTAPSPWAAATVKLQTLNSCEAVICVTAAAEWQQLIISAPASVHHWGQKGRAEDTMWQRDISDILPQITVSVSVSGHMLNHLR